MTNDEMTARETEAARILGLRDAHGHVTEAWYALHGEAERLPRGFTMVARLPEWHDD